MNWKLKYVSNDSETVICKICTKNPKIKTWRITQWKQFIGHF